MAHGITEFRSSFRRDFSMIARDSPGAVSVVIDVGSYVNRVSEADSAGFLLESPQCTRTCTLDSPGVLDSWRSECPGCLAKLDRAFGSPSRQQTGRPGLGGPPRFAMGIAFLTRETGNGRRNPTAPEKPEPSCLPPAPPLLPPPLPHEMQCHLHFLSK